MCVRELDLIQNYIKIKFQISQMHNNLLIHENKMSNTNKVLKIIEKNMNG